MLGHLTNHFHFNFPFFPQAPFPDLALEMSLEWQLSQNTLLAVLHMMMERIAQEELRQQLGYWSDIDDQEEREEGGDQEEEHRQQLGDWRDIDKEEKREEDGDLKAGVLIFPFVVKTITGVGYRKIAWRAKNGQNPAWNANGSRSSQGCGDWRYKE